MESPLHPHRIPQGQLAPPQGTVALLIHGGAWDIPDAHCAEHIDGMERAVALGRLLLEAGQPAAHVVAQVVASMESHGAFDAGRGAVLTREETVELDAGLMDGSSLAYASVACMRHQPNPILVAARLLQVSTGEVRLLVGDGADAFAVEQGFPRVDNAALRCTREQERFVQLQQAAQAFHTSHAFLPELPSQTPTGTVGCLARDQYGHLAAATSTGGTPFRPSGRVGDSPLPGCGFYANGYGAASATGWGEAIAASVLCTRAVDAVQLGMEPDRAAAHFLALMRAQIHNKAGAGATGGLILMAADGTAGWAYTTPRMARAGWSAGHEPWTAL